MADELEYLTERILALSEFDRERLLSKCAAHAKKAPKVSPMGREGQVVWDAICAALGMRLPLGPFLESYSDKKYSEKTSLIYEFIQDSRMHLNEAQVQGLIALIVRCLASYVRMDDHRLGPKELLNNTDKLGSAVDRAFPGYVAAGLLHKVVPTLQG